MLKKAREAREARQLVREVEAAAAERDRLAAEVGRVAEATERARLTIRETRVPGVALKKGEIAYLALDGVGLVEPRRLPGKWSGGSAGTSVRVAKGVNLRVGRIRGTYQPGEERPQVIDTGMGLVTNQRMLFVGNKRSTEWAYSKLLGFSLEMDAMAIFNVSNRQKASGFAYPEDIDYIVDAVVTAAIAQFTSDEDHAAVVAEFEDLHRERYEEWRQAASRVDELIASAQALSTGET